MTDLADRLRSGAAALVAGIAALAFAAAALAQEPIAVPKLGARVTDLSGTLAPDERASLEARLAAFEQSRGSQVAVLVVPTIGSETIEEFAGRVADAWALGRKGVDDGVLFAIAMQERRMRIHVGRGVQGSLTDAASKRIVADVVAPRFRERDFSVGIRDGVDAIMRAIEGEALPPPSAKPVPKRASKYTSFEDFALLGLFVVPIVAMALRRTFGRLLGSGATAGLTGVVGWFLFGSLAIALVAAFFGLVFALFSGSGMGRSARGGGWGGYIPSGGGGSWGGGGGGGGFSGGGGGFDGGGASGGW